MRRSRSYLAWAAHRRVSSAELALGVLADTLVPVLADSSQSAGSLLLAGLKTLPANSPSVPFDAHANVFSCLLFCHLLRNTEACKRVAREVTISDSPEARSPPPPVLGPDGKPQDDQDEEEKIGLVHIVVGNLMMAQREQSQLAATASSAVGATAGTHLALLGEWSRVMVGYLMVLSVWMWESPRSVKEFLSEGSNLQVLIEPITQASGVDSVVQGLSAFLLGIIYEYNREPGTVTRATMHPLLQTRVGPDVFANRILRLREDVRFKNVGPDVLEMVDDEDSNPSEDGIWFDWPFVEYLKNNYLAVQRSILLDPGASDLSRSAGGDNTESLELIASLRTAVSEQKKENDELQKRILDMSGEQEEERNSMSQEISRLTERLAMLQAEVESAKEKAEKASARQEAAEKDLADSQQALSSLEAKVAEAEAKVSASKETSDGEEGKTDAEKEQEDLLVLLEELSSKRKADKAKMREAGLDVSEDEEDDEDDEADA